MASGKQQNHTTGTKRKSGKTIEVLFKISDAVTKTRNLKELYRVIHKSLAEILNVDNFYIALFNEQKDEISFPFYVDEKDKIPEKISNFSRRPSPTARVIQERRPMIFYEQDLETLAGKDRDSHIGTISKIWLGAPLVINDRVKGAMAIQSYRFAGAYGNQDLDLLNSVSQHVALAIERKESENEIKEQKEVLTKILESSPVGISMVQNRVFKWVNNEMVTMFGYVSKKDFENKSTRIIYSTTDDYDLFGQVIYSSLSQKNSADYEVDLKRMDGSSFPAHIRLSTEDFKDPMALTIATITDLSKRRSAEKEKVEKERLQGVLELAGAVCHEINQPLQAILGYSELLLLDEALGVGTKNNINSIKSQASRLGRITKKLSNITCYRTVEYPGNTTIVDIWGASKDMKK